MKSIIKIIGFIIVHTLFAWVAQAQIETTILNTSTHSKANKAPFFTNRPIVFNKDSSYTFKNSSKVQTNTLYFCHYDFDTDSIEIDYRTVNLSDSYPTEKTKHNMLYQIYQKHRIERGVKNFYIIVGGYGKSFKKQINSYMRRLKANYGDLLFDKAAIIVFAWGTEDKAYRYYNAFRASKRGAADFAIFQHMLDEFVSDEEFFKTHPKDLTINILFSSMGNELLRNYLINREKQNIPLVKTYDRIELVGSVAPRNSFNEGKAFYNLQEMTDTVDVFVNSKDFLLKMASVAQLKNRLGNKGPKNADDLPGYINVIYIKNIITREDMSGLGHDYLLTNQILRNALLEGINDDITKKTK